MKDIKPIKIVYDKLKDKKIPDKTNQNSNDDEEKPVTKLTKENISENNQFEESKDVSKSINKNGFNIKNIDFKDLKEKLNNIYNDERLVANVINHIRTSLNSSVEIQWETSGLKNKISVKSRGAKKYVNLSSYLVSRAENGEKTLQVLHNHTSGTPLPHNIDLTNVKDYKIVNSGIVGNYGYLNMKNSFINLDEKNIYNFRTKASKIYREIDKEIYNNDLSLKNKHPSIKKVVKYIYFKENIDKIIKKYNEKFENYGIEFKYAHYKLKR